MSTTELRSWKPRSYQADGVKLMVSQACCGLLYKPGLGKTSVVYAAASILLSKGYVNKILVICPIRPMYNVWPYQCKDYKEFAHLRVKVLHGPDKDEALCDDDADIYVINPEGLEWLFNVRVVTKTKQVRQRDGTTVNRKYKEAMRDPIRDKWLRERFQMLVVDESTEFKSHSSNRYLILKDAIKFFKRRYIMTGTPTPKSLMDLFGQVYLLDEGNALGRFITHFRTRFFYPTGYGGYDWQPQPEAKERIVQRLTGLCQVVEAEGNIDLPEVLFNDVWVTLPDDVMKQYRAMEDDLKAEVASGTIVAENAAAASSKCRQIANGAIYHEDGEFYTEIHNAKIEALKEILENLQGDPVLVTYEFKFDRDRIEAQLGIPCISSGDIRADNERIQQFSNGFLPAVQGHPKSIGLGIDGLQRHCSTIAMVGVTWNLLHYEQVIDRIKRSGSTAKHVIVHRILARDTLDEQVIKVLDARDRQQRDFMRLLATEL